MRELVTEITRGVHDSFFSADELFYRHFQKMPSCHYEAGANDDDEVSDCCSGSEVNSGSTVAMRGQRELQCAVDEFLAHVNQKFKEPLVEGIDYHIHKYVNYTSLAFAAFVVLCKFTAVVKIRVYLTKKGPMVQGAILSDEDKSEIWEHMAQYVHSLIRPSVPRPDEINIITVSDGEFYLKSIPLVNSRQQEFSYDFYNENFKPISERILTSLRSSKDCGLVLLHGNPGTGKTSYLKYLLHTVSSKKLIYLPPDLIEHLSAPNFISFLMSSAENSILLIEDAENVLRPREAGGNQAVSNILNVSDGILGDVLHLQIVCTFNSRIEDIDSALVRPGRLIAEYRFEKLTKARTKNLMQKLYGNDVVCPKDEMTLADIFNFENMPDKTHKPRMGVGFVPIALD